MSHTATLPATDLQKLKARVTGSLSTPQDKRYDAERTPWLDVIDQHPTVIVNAHTVQDIVETVRFAQEKSLPLSVQNTGHGIARACDGGILLRLTEMKTLTIDAAAQTATIGPGIRSGDLLAATEPLGFAFPTGQVSNVGVTAYTLGGGVGWLSRELGPACRRLRAATVVLADGSIVTASRDENPDLFWALRGGGGNFGVVVSLTLDLVPLRTVWGGYAFYRIKDAPDVLRFYREWSATLGSETSTVARLMQMPPTPAILLHLHGNQTCAIGICHTDLATADALHDQIRRFKTPAMDQLERRAYSSMGSFEPASSAETEIAYSQMEFFKDINDPFLGNLTNMTEKYLPPLTMVQVQQFGATLAKPDDTIAYTSPAAPFSLQALTLADHKSLQTNGDKTQEALATLQAAYTGETSYNFLRGDQQDRVADAFDATKYQRLRSIKKQYDPTNFFRFNINIPPL